MDELRMLARLNEETLPHHADADADVERYLFRPHVTVDDYRAYLVRVYGFLVPVEAALNSAPGLDEVIDVQARAKSALVVRDLLALGMTMSEVNDRPRCTSVPAFRGPATALGWMYVVERPLLASAVLRGHLASFLGPQLALASSYLSCYAGLVGAMWRELGDAMDRVADSPTMTDRIVMSAHEAFRMQRRFRRGEDPSEPTIRVAG